MTYQTHRQQYNAFRNQDIYGYLRIQNADRILCREQFIAHDAAFSHSNTMDTPKTTTPIQFLPPTLNTSIFSQSPKRSSFQMGDFIKDIQNAQTYETISNINICWDKLKSTFSNQTEYMIPLLDMSIDSTCMGDAP